MRYCPWCKRPFEDAVESCPYDNATLYIPDTGDHLPFIGKLINTQFRIVGFLGSGAFASVFLAQQESLNRPVAMKIMRADFDGDQLKEIMELFDTEAEEAG